LPNPQSPIPNPQEIIKISHQFKGENNYVELK